MIQVYPNKVSGLVRGAGGQEEVGYMAGHTVG